MMVPSSLINHKQGRDRLVQFLEDPELRLCVISAPAHHGKSTLCEWLYAHVTGGGRAASFIQLNTLLHPSEIMNSILQDLKVAASDRHNMRACRPSPGISISMVRDIRVINSQHINFEALSNAITEDDHFVYSSDLFEAFVLDLDASGAGTGFVLVIDNYEKCDKRLQDWIYTRLLRLTKLLPSIKIVFFCQTFEKDNLEIAVTRVSREYHLRPIEDPQEVYEWLREHGQNIDEQIKSSVANAFDYFRAEPLAMANALKILLPRPQLKRSTFQEVLPK